MRRPPCSLQLNNQTYEDTEHEKPSICPHPPKMKIKSSPLIEKLQANLALSSSVLLSPPKSPETKQPPAVSNPISPCSSLRSTLQPVQLSCEDEVPVSFEQPAEGTPLPSINKSRARLSFKRRLPTRQHRKSAGEEAKAHMEDESSRQPDNPPQKGDEDEVSPLPEDFSHTDPEKQKRDGMENRDAFEENDRTEVTENDEEVSEGVTLDEHQPSDCKQTQEPEQEGMAEDQTEMMENEELLGTEKTPEEK